MLGEEAAGGKSLYSYMVRKKRTFNTLNIHKKVIMECVECAFFRGDAAKFSAKNVQVYASLLWYMKSTFNHGT